MKIFRQTLILVSLIISVLAASASPLRVKARLDSAQLLMGNITMLHLEVTQKSGLPGEFPMFSRMSADGIIGVCGDSVELRTSFKRDTIDKGSGVIQINYTVPVQAFDSGLYQLPEFVYVSARDTARSNTVALKVIPVPVNADAQISDFAGPVSPDGSIFDAVPDWIIDLWWLWLAILVLVALFIIGMRRYRKQGSVLKKKPEPNPYEVALRRLENLKRRKLWEQGMEKEYFTLLTDILREYLERRFGINALEMTSAEIINSLTDNTEVKDKRSYMRDILAMADFVKFAKVRPLPQDNISAFENALRFVEETKPAINPDETATELNAEDNIKTGLDLSVKDASERKNLQAADKKKGGER